MGSCMVALDPATRDNGCLQVLRGSHRLGRLDHGPVIDGQLETPEGSAMGGARVSAAGRSSAEQHGADPQRVSLAQAGGCQRLHCEMEPGDA